MKNIEHTKRIRRVIDYIDQNLNSHLSLKKIAAMGYYSPFHFHRIFKGIVGENLQDFILRKRLEKSALMLSKDKNKPLLESPLKMKLLVLSLKILKSFLSDITELNRRVRFQGLG